MSYRDRDQKVMYSRVDMALQLGGGVTASVTAAAMASEYGCQSDPSSAAAITRCANRNAVAAGMPYVVTISRNDGSIARSSDAGSAVRKAVYCIMVYCERS